MGTEPPPLCSSSSTLLFHCSSLNSLLPWVHLPCLHLSYLEPCPASSQNPLTLVMIGRRHLWINQGCLYPLVGSGKTVLVLWMTGDFCKQRNKFFHRRNDENLPLPNSCDEAFPWKRWHLGDLLKASRNTFLPGPHNNHSTPPVPLCQSQGQCKHTLLRL